LVYDSIAKICPESDSIYDLTAIDIYGDERPNYSRSPEASEDPGSEEKAEQLKLARL
jgi:hypothetical protein